MFRPSVSFFKSLQGNVYGFIYGRTGFLNYACDSERVIVMVVERYATQTMGNNNLISYLVPQ